MPPTRVPGSPTGQTGLGAPDDGRGSERRRALLLALVFFCVLAVGMWHHEMWRDEWHAWMLGRDAASLGELLRQLRIEGHLPAWYLVLFGLGRLTRDPVAMQFAHLAIATGAVYLLGRFGPFPWIFKVLAAFSYFLAYEYAVLARPYALGVLALFAFCALFPRRHDHRGAVAAALVLLGITSLYGLIIAGAAGGMLLLEAVWSGGPRESSTPRHHATRMALVGWVIATGMAVVVAVVHPLHNLTGVLGTSDLPPLSTWALASTASTLAQAYLPFPDLSADHMWGTHVFSLDSRTGLAVAGCTAMILAGSALLMLAPTPLILFFYVMGTAGLMLFGHLVFGGFLRHHGHLFLLFVACLWLAAHQRVRWHPPPRLERWTGLGAVWVPWAVAGLLVVQVASAGILYAAELTRPFSAASLATDFIRDRGLEELPMAASPAPPATSIAGALDRPMHYLAMGATGTFIRWDRYPRRLDRNLTMSRMRAFLDAHPSGALVILGSPFAEWDQDLEVTELARFEAGLEAREAFVLYHVRAGA